MNEHTLRVLEYDKVKSVVASYAFSESGRIVVRGLDPASDRPTVETLLKETGEFMQILESGDNAPLDGTPDIRDIPAKLSVSGSVLSPAELLNCAKTLAAGRRVKKFFQRFEGKGTAPLLVTRAALIRPLTEIEESIVAAIDDKAEVKDSASPGLRKIRKQIGRMRDDILSRMNSILQRGGFQKVIQEPVITLRDERYVLPLKPNFRQSLQGLVHGQSSSRATVFVEPLDVLEQNNRLAELRIEERDEIERILRELTALLSEEAEAFATTAEALAGIDAVQARARFGLDYNGAVPLLSGDRTIRLRAAKHPLLMEKYKKQPGEADVTPNDIVLEGRNRVMILSGPNAGGKTVVLKTAGLLCLMAQSGLPIPAREQSEVPCFSSVFADIGDEQSLEQDLSTFSSHVGRIAEIMQQASGDSLVLLDELGAGTEPGEGAALGAAVLESLIERGCMTVVTTHHNALKVFGSETSGAVNAAMEFDPQTLKPTYRMIPGRPGRSYGLDMAARLGLPDAVIERARARLGQDDVRLEKLLEQVEENSRLLGEERQLLEKELSAARQEKSEAEAALRSALDEAADVKSKARTDAREVIAALKQKLREFSRSASLNAGEIKKTSVDLESLQRRLETQEPRVAGGPVLNRDIRPGDTVRVARLNKTGTVIALQGDILELEIGGKKVRLSSGGVAIAGKESGNRQATPASGWAAELDTEEAADRVNIIGLHVPEALAEVDRFIDRAGLHHLSIVTVIHGIGTGALKTAVTDFLKTHPLVAAVRSGEPAEGGAGVTVVELKK